MGMPNRETRLALLTNFVAPYRLPLFSYLADQFDLLVLHGGKEANRDSWSNLEEPLSNAKVVRAWGWQMRHAKKVNGEVFDQKFIHITPGLVWHLLLFRPDAILSGEMGFRSVVALAYGALFRKPVWIWWEGTLRSERKVDLLRRVIRKAFVLCANHWISFGETSTEHLLSLGVRRDRILQLQNAVDEERFRAPVEPAWTIEPRPVVLYVGQLIERKGVKLLLDAAATVQQNGVEFSLLLVGSGRDKETLQHRANALNLKNVHFLTAQPAERMPAVYRSADLMVLPTLEDVWGLVANEAILSGIPILCSKYAGCAAELFGPEHLFAPDDPHEFSQKLETAVSGGLSKADPARLKTTQQLGDELVQELRRWLTSATTNERSESRVPPGLDDATNASRQSRISTNAGVHPMKLMKHEVQRILRAFNLAMFDRGLPNHMAIYAHSLERGWYEAFREFVEYFRAPGYQFVGPEEFLKGAVDKTIFLSFDDNYRSWFEAAEMLSKLSLTATFYVNPAVLRDRATELYISKYYDRVVYSGERVPLNSRELLALASSGHVIGSHTYSHLMLTSLSGEDAREEIRRGKVELENILGKPVLHFSYPFGRPRHFSEELRQYCKTIGIETVASGTSAMQHSIRSPFNIQRSLWRFDRPLARNIENLRVDGRLFTMFTGRSATVE